VLVLLATQTPFPEESWWQQSALIGHLQDGARHVRDWLPEKYAEAIVFPSEATPEREPVPVKTLSD